MDAAYQAVLGSLQEQVNSAALKLRAAAANEVASTKAELARREEALRQRELQLDERERELERLHAELRKREEALQAKEALLAEGSPVVNRYLPETPTPTRAQIPPVGSTPTRSPPETPTQSVSSLPRVGYPPAPADVLNSPRLSTASAGSASQLRAAFERKSSFQASKPGNGQPLATEARKTWTPRIDPPAAQSTRRESGGTTENGSLSFRSHEGAFRQSMTVPAPSPPFISGQQPSSFRQETPPSLQPAGTSVPKRSLADLLKLDEERLLTR